MIKRRAIFLILIICVVGCSNNNYENRENIAETSIENNDVLKNMEEALSPESNRGELKPLKPQWQADDRTFNPEDTIYYKTFYDDFVQGSIMDIKFPDINHKDNLDDYFIMNQNTEEKWDSLVSLFFDNRTIEIEEKVLRDLFFSFGYEIYFHSSNIDDLCVRFIEICEINGLALYPELILMQSWDNDYIYLQNITAPIPRKIRSFIVLDNSEEPRLIVHSSGLSESYLSEEELSFWSFRGSYWILTSIDLTIDSSHAHSAGNMYPDEDRNNLFEPTYYQDGIVYRPSVQGDGLHSYTYRLGKMEEMEKNKSFKLIGIRDVEGRALENPGCYITFEIN